MVAAALTLMYGAQIDLKYVSEASVHQMECENDQLKELLKSNVQRTRNDAQKIADLEARVKGLAIAKD
jgi:hypothetical protein